MLTHKGMSGDLYKIFMSANSIRTDDFFTGNKDNLPCESLFEIICSSPIY